MTLDESFQVAVQRLNQQGQLLNGQLLKLLEGDKDAFREIRARLISEGFAEDRFGVGLGRLENAPAAVVPHLADLAADESLEESERSAENEPNTASNADWYLMASGITQGPMTFESLCEMRVCGEIQPADVVRNGTYGFWQRPDDVPELAAIKPNQRKRSPKIPVQEKVVLEELPTRSKAIGGVNSPGSKLTTEESGFYFWESGRSVGPVSRTELLERLKAGRLSRDEFVRFGIDGEWQPVSAIIAETNLVTSLPPSKSFEPSNEHQRQRNDQPLGSLSDVDIEQPDARPRIEVSTPPAPTSTKRLVATRPTSNANTPPAEPVKVQVRPTSIIQDLWRRASRGVGGEKRLTQIIMASAVVFGACLWMRQPPSASSIYQEFNRFHDQIVELKSRGVNDQAQWKRDIDRALSRTQALVTGLKDPKTGASALRPAKQELLWAGQDSLLKLLESPNIDPQTAKVFEEQFEYHMNQARRLLDGGTRSLPQEFALPSKRPDASGPPRAGAKAPQGPPGKPATPPRP